MEVIFTDGTSHSAFELTRVRCDVRRYVLYITLTTTIIGQKAGISEWILQLKEMLFQPYAFLPCLIYIVVYFFHFPEPNEADQIKSLNFPGYMFTNQHLNYESKDVN